MSDTPAEQEDHREPVARARGRVLIAGLGIGMVVQAMLDKPEVTHLTVVEISLEVIALVGPHYRERYGERLTIVQGDINVWPIPRGSRWEVIWFDIWDEICHDNVKQMGQLKRRFARCSGWRGCWAQELARWNR